MAWKIFFALKPGAPSVFVHNGAKYNLRNPNFPLVKLLKAYRDGCNYLVLTDRGRAKYAEILGRVKLPATLPSDIKGRNIQLLLNKDLTPEGKTDTSGSGTGEGAPEGNEDFTTLTPEEVVAKALAFDLIEQKGTSYLYNGAKHGTKAILGKEDIIEELRALIEQVAK